MAHLADRAYVEKLRAALEQQLGGRLAVKVGTGAPADGAATLAGLEAKQRSARQAAADEAVQGDDFVRDLVNMFGAKVVGTQARGGEGGN